MSHCRPKASSEASPSHVAAARRRANKAAVKWELQQQQHGGFLQSSNRQARGPSLPQGKLSRAELAEFASQTVEPTSQTKLPVGFVLGYSRTNGGYGSKADTIAKQAGKASGSR